MKTGANSTLIITILDRLEEEAQGMYEISVF